MAEVRIAHLPNCSEVLTESYHPSGRSIAGEAIVLNCYGESLNAAVFEQPIAQLSTTTLVPER
jgi:hypothetical protein